MSDKVRVRVWKEGRETKRELVVDETPICELSFIDTLKLAMQATSTLRYEDRDATL